MATKVVLTGSSGYIGSHLYRKFADSKSVKVTACDKKDGKSVFDTQLEAAVKWSNVVYHLAAELKDVRKMLEDNILATARVLYLCHKYHKKLIYTSSAAVFEPKSSVYAVTKEHVERMISFFHPSIPIVVLRLFNVYGGNMNPERGSVMYRFGHDNPITVYGDGNQTRDFVHVDDVVSILTQALKKEWNGKVVDVGTGKERKIKDIAELFRKYRDVAIEYKSEYAGIRYSWAETEELKKLYKKPLKTDIEAEIKKLCSHQ